MSQTQKTTHVVTRESETNVLDQILDQVQTLSAQHNRPSPIHLKSWEEIERFAEKAARSGMVPKDYVGKPDAIVIGVMMGAELGLAPMQALQNIAVVNGRPSIWGDAMPALCRASGIVRHIKEWSTGDGDELTFFCEAVRKDDPNPIVGRFSIADAKKAGLWKDAPKTKRQGRDGSSYEVDSGPWYSYPRRMLQMRARGFALRDAFPDVLKGLISVEEAQDIPFEATGLTPRMEVPEPTPTQAEPKKQTSSEWLDEIDMRLRDAADGDSVDVIIAEDKTQKMLDWLRNGAKTRLNAMIAEALARTRPEDFVDEATEKTETAA